MPFAVCGGPVVSEVAEPILHGFCGFGIFVWGASRIVILKENGIVNGVVKEYN